MAQPWSLCSGPSLAIAVWTRWTRDTWLRTAVTMEPHTMGNHPWPLTSLVELCGYGKWGCACSLATKELEWKSRRLLWTLFYHLLASGQQPQGGAGGAANTWGRMVLHPANPPAAKLVWELPPSPCRHPYASLPAQEGYHTFPLCWFSCLANYRQAGCTFTRGVLQ